MSGIPRRQEQAETAYYCHTCGEALAPSRVGAEVHAAEGCEVVDLGKDGLPISGTNPSWRLRESMLADGSPVYDVTCGDVTFYAMDEDCARRLLSLLRGCAAVWIA